MVVPANRQMRKWYAAPNAKMGGSLNNQRSSRTPSSATTQPQHRPAITKTQ